MNPFHWENYCHMYDNISKVILIIIFLMYFHNVEQRSLYTFCLDKAKCCSLLQVVLGFLLRNPAQYVSASPSFLKAGCEPSVRERHSLTHWKYLHLNDTFNHYNRLPSR